MANWRFTDNLYYGAQGMSIRAFLTAADNEATAFSSQFSLITLSFLCQYINKTGFRACVKELFVQQHDPLSLSYAVLPGEKALKFLWCHSAILVYTDNWLWNYLQWSPSWLRRNMTRRSSMQSSRRAIFSFLIFFLAYSHCKLQNVLVSVRVVSIFGPFFRAGEKTYL